MDSTELKGLLRRPQSGAPRNYRKLK